MTIQQAILDNVFSAETLLKMQDELNQFIADNAMNSRKQATIDGCDEWNNAIDAAFAVEGCPETMPKTKEGKELARKLFKRY